MTCQKQQFRYQRDNVILASLVGLYIIPSTILGYNSDMKYIGLCTM